jgi:hypothetical protein
MTRHALAFAVSLAMWAALAATAAAQHPDDAAPSPEAGRAANAAHAMQERRCTVRVRVVSSDGRAAPEGIPVELTVMLREIAAQPMTATTDAAGTAEFVVAVPLDRPQGALCMAALRYGGVVFVSEAAAVGADAMPEPLELTLRVWPPSGRVPAWSYLVLASLWVLAVGLVACRRSDGQLTS